MGYLLAGLRGGRWAAYGGTGGGVWELLWAGSGRHRLCVCMGVVCGVRKRALVFHLHPEPTRTSRAGAVTGRSWVDVCVHLCFMAPLCAL